MLPSAARPPARENHRRQHELSGRAGDPSGHFVATEAEELARAGHGVTVVVPTTSDTPWCPPHVTVESTGGGEAFGWPGVLARVRARPWRLFGVVRFVLAARRALRRLADAGPIDGVIAHWAVPCAWPLAAGVGPVVAVSHGADVRLLRWLPFPLRAFVVRRLLRVVSEWRFVSARLRASLLAELPADVAAAVEACSVVLPSPIAMPTDEGASPEATSERTYVVVGRLVPKKRVAHALRHVAEKHRGDGTRPRVVILGDGPERRRLEREARSHALDAQFLGLRSRPETLAWIAAADALVFAARAEDEGEPTVLREARLLGTPVELVD